jgi:GNAT superfamily N-acetyltransferase
VSDVQISVAPAIEHSALNQIYLRWGYHGGIAASDHVLVAHLDGQPVGIVRRTRDFDVVMLRGMYIDPEYQRSGIGTRLLHAFATDLSATDCFCIPFAHLAGFYAQIGFAVIADAEAGALLHERLLHYRAEGHDVLLMRRTASTDRDRAS